MTIETPRILVEACVDSIASALAAEAAGANRIELCGWGVGGTTPTFGLMSRCRELVRIPIHVMIRPREGNFTYNDDEFTTMQKDIGAARSAGVDGVVYGILSEDGTLDEARMIALGETARPLRIVCHRAFDATPHAGAALDTLVSMGVDEVLTSGHAPNANAGMVQLAEHCRVANGRIVVMAGGGVRADNVREITAFTKAPHVHVRATDSAVFSAVMERLGRHTHSHQEG
jgi:copper homeostasis protein